ncbi:MAG: hypothetical protein HYU73_20455 [Betaproteobacteria bacterium]|nr:hypothetical protein [Betaproteobacteria bacterium]
MMTRPDNSIDMFLRAYHTAISGRPGPVVIQIPFDIQNTPDFGRLARSGLRGRRRPRSGSASAMAMRQGMVFIASPSMSSLLLLKIAE